MEPGIAEVLGPAPQPTRIIRTLWRMQGPSRIIAARVERHPFGRELVVVFEGRGRDDVLETRYERVNFSMLEQRAEELRELLAGKGWSELRNVS
jgi:hypothetical protein